jgi:hypothetical protein
MPCGAALSGSPIDEEAQPAAAGLTRETAAAVTTWARGFGPAPKAVNIDRGALRSDRAISDQDHSDRRPQPGINWPVILSLTVPMQAWRRTRGRLSRRQRKL